MSAARSRCVFWSAYGYDGWLVCNGQRSWICHGLKGARYDPIPTIGSTVIVGGQLPREKELTADNPFDKLNSQVQTSIRTFYFLEPTWYESEYSYDTP